MFDKQPEDHSNTNQTKFTSDIPTMTTIPHSTAGTQLATMQKDLATMAQVINLLSTSISKMDKLDKIDAIESRQQSSETMLNNMVINFQSEIDELKTTTAFNNTANSTANYANILKNLKKQTKIKHHLPAQQQHLSKSLKHTNPNTKQKTRNNPLVRNNVDLIKVVI